MILWIIGMSGAGKTTLGSEIYRQLKEEYPHTVILDGEIVRELFDNDLGHNIADRRRNSDRITRLCNFLNQQGIHVVCPVLSIFHDAQSWNHAHWHDYFEVYIDAPLDTLIARDPKGLYQAALRGEVKNVVGIDIPFLPPLQPDFVIRSTGTRVDLLAYVPEIICRLPGLG